jgi:hypothetical protein
MHPHLPLEKQVCKLNKSMNDRGSRENPPRDEQRNEWKRKEMRKRWSEAITYVISSFQPLAVDRIQPWRG